MQPQTLELLRELGAKSVDIGGNEPIRLDQEDRVWMVETGKMEIFAVHNDELSHGPRTHITTIEAGKMLFGIQGQRQMAPRPFGRKQRRERSTALLAVSVPDTRLLEMPTAAFAQLAREPQQVRDLEEGVEEWLAGLFRKIPRAQAPQRFETLSSGQEIQLAESEVGRTASGVVWVRHVSGESRFLGRQELPIQPSAFLVPISDETWLVTDKDTVLSCVGTGNLVKSGTVWESLSRFHELFLDYVELQVVKSRAEELDRLRRKMEVDQETMAGAQQRLAAVLDETTLGGAIKTALPGGGRSDPLLIACQIAGDPLGVTFRLPPEGRKALNHAHLLSRICAVSRIRYRLVMLRDDWYRKDNGPLVAFLRSDEENPQRLQGRPVALVPTSATAYDLVDATTGERRPLTPELAAELEVEAFMFYPPLPERKIRLIDLGRLAVRGRQGDLATLLLMGAAAGLIGTLVPILTGQLFGTVVPSADRSQVVEMTLALVAAAVATLGFHITRAVALLRLSGKLDGSVQAAIWDRMLALPVAFFKDYTVGDLASRSMGIDQIRNLVLGSVMTSFLGAIFSVFSFALLFYYSPGMALVATLLIGLLLSVTSILVFLQVGHQRVYLKTEGNVSSMLFGMINGLSKLRVAGAEARAYSRWAERFSEQQGRSIRARRLGNIQTAFNGAYGVITSLVLFAFMGAYMEEQLRISEFLAFFAAFGQFQAASLSLIGLFSSVLTMVPLYERLMPILETPPEVDEAKSEVSDLSGDVEMSHVSFRYQKDGPLILDDVSIRARPGEFIALVGPSGSGKSTTMRLILGFEQPEAGSIYFDGQDLPSIDMQSVRRQMGVVLQNGKPLAGDVYSNIVGSTNLGIEEAWDAARAAGLEEDLKQMPMGMHTVVGEGGGTFSGGQTQRLMIARAIVHRPRIMIMDEATSALDNRTQEIVTQSLERLKATRIVIAHRLSTIRGADRIYVLVRGRVVEEGSYDELMAKGGVFTQLASRQIA